MFCPLMLPTQNSREATKFFVLLMYFLVKPTDVFSSYTPKLKSLVKIILRNE